MQSSYFVYILTDSQNEKFYTGVTNDLCRRIWEHKEGVVAGYTKENSLVKLVYYESYQDVRDAIQREKLMKKWKRNYKIDAINKFNHDWEDLYFQLNG
ncbi:MAG: GIY-YIG nuclease family protein [Rickettsiales bacterium]|nr:GIY-YIG nuclease family protein [Rickettsiales bacterium]